MSRVQVQVSSLTDDLQFLTNALAVTSRTWVRNDVGTATIVVPYSHPRLRELAAYGNVIRIKERNFPTWVGQVVQREWDSSNGTVVLSCKSAEWMLQKKVTGQGRVYAGNSGNSAGAVAYSIYDNAARANSDLRQIRPGYFNSPKTAHREYNYADLFEALKDMAEDYGADFWVDEELKLHFTTRGADRRGVVVLREGRHLSGVRVADSAEEMVTAVVGLGEGNSIPEKPKLLRKLTGTPFFRAEVLDVNGVGSEDALRSPVEEKLIKDGQPRVTVDASVERINGTYGNFWIGDTITLVTRHPFLRQVDVQVVGIERGESDSMRAVFSALPATQYTNIVPWTVI